MARERIMLQPLSAYRRAFKKVEDHMTDNTRETDETSDVARTGDEADANRQKLEREAEKGISKAAEKVRDGRSEPGAEAEEPSPQ